MNSYIYALIHPITKDIKYIGKSCNPKRRLWEHLGTKELNNRTYKSNWIKSLLVQGLKPVLKVITAISEIGWEKRERYYIKYYRDLGCKLTNINDGGASPMVGQLPWNTGKKLSEETKTKISKALMGNKHSVERNVSLETRKKLRIAGLGRKVSNKTKLKISLLKQGKKRIKTKQFVGICYRKDINKWVSRIGFNNKKILVGYFDTPKDAALAYNTKALELYGKNAKLNLVSVT